MSETDERKLATDPIRLDLGRGGNRRLWKTVDIDSHIKPNIVCNCIYLDNFDDESVDEIFTSHMLEHIHPLDTMTALINWRKKLKVNGLITIYVPDCKIAFQRLLNSEISDDEVASVVLGSKPDRKYQLHLNFFWYTRLEKLMYRAGFRNMIELPTRGQRLEFGIQARKIKSEEYFENGGK